VNFWHSWHTFCAKYFQLEPQLQLFKSQNALNFQWFFVVPAFGISQAKDVLSEQKHLTKTKPKGKL